MHIAKVDLDGFQQHIQSVNAENQAKGLPLPDAAVFVIHILPSDLAANAQFLSESNESFS
jgi:hypothetical protein